MNISRWLMVIAVLLTAALTVGACQEEPTEEPIETGIESQIDLENVPCGAAFVDAVRVEESGDGEYVAVVEGHYPSACDQLGKVEQTVEGDTISITMCSARPPDAMCAQLLTPFVETLPIDTEGFDAGTYTVEVNGATTKLTIE